jgi:hypothetical protein
VRKQTLEILRREDLEVIGIGYGRKSAVVQITVGAWKTGARELSDPHRIRLVNLVKGQR